jgi:hypothetical protein
MADLKIIVVENFCYKFIEICDGSTEEDKKIENEL